jgi:peptidoglycan hydrolase CwlO-like protein
MKLEVGDELFFVSKLLGLTSITVISVSDELCVGSTGHGGEYTFSCKKLNEEFFFNKNDARLHFYMNERNAATNDIINLENSIAKTHRKIAELDKEFQDLKESFPEHFI